jgi:hypothetical protein
MNKGELLYLACPYIDKNREVMLERVKKVDKLTATLLSKGFYIFSPISHCHHLAEEAKLPGDWNFWEGYDRAMIKACKGLLVFKLPGWEQSVGVNAEILIAKELELPIEYIEASEIR